MQSVPWGGQALDNNLEIVDATAEDIESFCSQQTIRQEDLGVWVLLGGGRRPQATLRRYAKDSSVVRAFKVNGEVHILWGVLEGYGWFIASTEAKKHWRWLQRRGLREAKALGPDLRAITLTPSKREDIWHRSLGFEVEETTYMPGCAIPVTIYRRP